jgi:Tol biopolymer transport system component
MNDSQWRDAWEIFRAAREREGEERVAFLSSLQADPEILAAVAALLDEPDEASSAVQPSRIGAHFGRYEVVGMLGSGGMGQVYSGRDTELERMVAIKFLSPELAASRPAMDRLIREAKATSALNHPHIVTVYEILRAGDDVAIAMELVEGSPVRQHTGNPLPSATVVQWGRQIAQALAAAHQRQIVHRDIKPENLMVREDGILKVLDFGLAQQTAVIPQSRATHPLSTQAGTLSYMSPEQTRGDLATSASDVFSLGIVLFELATGRHPFLSDSPLEIAHAIAHAEPRRPSVVHPGVSAALETVLLAALQKDPAKRPSATELDRRLAAIETGPAAVTTHRMVWLGAAAVAILAAGALALLQRQSFRAKPVVLTQLTAQVSENRVTAAALSPDGSTLAFAALGEAISLRRMSDGISRQLNTPEGVRVSHIAWFADGSRLLVSGSTVDSAMGGDNPAIWVIPTAGGQPRQIVPQGQDAVPSPDGARIALTSPDQSILWVLAADGSAPRQLRSGGTTSSFSSVLWSPDGKRVAYQRRDFVPAQSANITVNKANLERNYRYSYETVDADTGQVAAATSGFSMAAACPLSDGRILFVRAVAPGVSSQGVWEVRTDPRTGSLRGGPRLLTEDRGESWSEISASRDGKQVVAVRYLNSLPNIFVADLPPAGQPKKLLDSRRLTFSEAQEFPHTWTADSRSVIFESNRSGKTFDLYRQDIDRRNSELLVGSPAVKVMAHLAPGGQWVLYRESSNDVTWKIMRVPVAGGAPEVVLPATDINSEFRCGLRSSRCVLRTVENDQFVFYELDALRGKGRELARTAWTPLVVGDWDVSPDGTQVAIPNHDPRDARLRLVDLEAKGVGEKTVTLTGLQNLSGVVWAADGKGWYVSVYTEFGGLLTYVDLKDRIANLVESRNPSYAVPSADGRHIAFPQWSVSSNAWRLGLSQN